MARRACTSLRFHDGSVEEENGPTFFKIIRPETAGEHLPSYAAAAAFKSKFPYFAKVLAGSKMVAIPTHFYREIFSSSKYELFLVTSEGKFTVTLLPCTDTMMLSGGWSSFRNDNQLQEDDICIFELVKENTMVVHIFRN